ncbi:MAG: hypothetical protein ACNI3H_13335 [Halarcobacter ebronensis]
MHKDEGGFLEFFKNFLGEEKAVTKPMRVFRTVSKFKKFIIYTLC